MNSSRSATIPVRDPSLPLSSNKHLLKWIQKMFTLTQPDDHPLGGRLGGGKRGTLPTDGRRRHFHQA